MGWGVPKGPTTGDLDRVDTALTAAGIPERDADGFVLPFADRVRIALRRMIAAEGYVPPLGTCGRAPVGWWCSLEDGHDGPCPARTDFGAGS